MKKLCVTYIDRSKITYTMKNSVDHMEYVDKHINSLVVVSILLQQYPKKDNEPVFFKN